MDQVGKNMYVKGRIKARCEVSKHIQHCSFRKVEVEAKKRRTRLMESWFRVVEGY